MVLQEPNKKHLRLLENLSKIFDQGYVYGLMISWSSSSAKDKK